MENPTLKNITDPNFGKPPDCQNEVCFKNYIALHVNIIYYVAF